MVKKSLKKFEIIACKLMEGSDHDALVIFKNAEGRAIMSANVLFIFLWQHDGQFKRFITEFSCICS